MHAHFHTRRPKNAAALRRVAQERVGGVSAAASAEHGERGMGVCARAEAGVRARACARAAL